MNDIDAGQEAGSALSQSPQAVYMREYRARKRAERLAAAEAEADARPKARAEPDAGNLIDWIEDRLKVPNGPLAGKPFVVADFQAEWIAGALADGVQEAGMSIARKNGKSGVIAAVLLAGLCGPLNFDQWRGVVTSLTGALAKELRDAIMLTAAASGLDDALTLHKSPPPGLILGRRKSRLDILAADKATGHAIGSDLAVIDEGGLLQERQRGLWNAIYSSISGRNGRFWSISIQGDGPMFAELEQRGGSEGVFFRRWSCPMDRELDNEEGWHLANPGLATGIKQLGYMRRAASRAIAAPGNEQHFRAHDLNQDVDPERQVIVSLNDYRRCANAGVAPLEGECVLGFDLGGAASMTAAAAFCPGNGAIRVWGAFGDDPKLTERARNDRMGTLYDRMQRQGELKLYPGRVTPAARFIADVFEEVTKTCNVLAVGADRFRRAEASQAFGDAGLPPVKAFWRGQGASATADGSHDVRAFQALVQEGTLRPGGSVMLEAAIANSVLRFDGAGNPALDKSGKTARIDALSAAVIACGIGTLIDPAPLAGTRVHVV